MRELFFKEAPPPPPKNIEELRKGLDYEYFGYHTANKDSIEKLRIEQDHLRDELMESWIVKNAKTILAKYPRFAEFTKAEMHKILLKDSFDDLISENMPEVEASIQNEARMLELKKKELLDRYLTDDKEEIVDEQPKDNPVEFLEHY